MRVKIGKYPSRLTCNIFSDYMTKKYGYVDWPKQEQWTFFELFLENIDDIIQSVYDIVNTIWFDKRTQKIKVKIDPWDTWGMDHTLAHIIVPMLKQLKEDKHGAPFVDNEDVPSYLHMPEDWYDEKYSRNGETDPHFFERWHWVMDEMIFAFESKLDSDWEEQFFTGECDNVWAPVDKDGNDVAKENAVYYSMRNGPNHTLEIDWEGRKAYQERISNGFRLFGKYYESLWD